MTDGEEVIRGTNPASVDSDGDGIGDAIEIKTTDPMRIVTAMVKRMAKKKLPAPMPMMSKVCLWIPITMA